MYAVIQINLKQYVHYALAHSAVIPAVMMVGAYVTTTNEVVDMQAMDKIMTLIREQNPKGVNSGDWDRLTFKMTTTDEGTFITISPVSVGFAFDLKGNFKGIFNYKE